MPRPPPDTGETGFEASGGKEPSPSAILAVICDLKSVLTHKIDVVTKDVTLLRDDFKKISAKLAMAKSQINTLQTTTKQLEEQVQCLMKQHKLMAATFEDQEGRARSNNIRVVGVPEGAEGPSVDLFIEDLILNITWPKHLSNEKAHKALMPPP
ncbi:hypothetical protein NDU88_004915 [Pleurodeles waltl]|uniref:Uncharacterized protein n=1 Tax=Pleurodeles waltl TaxID=8319 RepID=A0AAV7T940_PLEWA|nr:hypothetical protein NDU88_004915 [Pleurodeles waltl]